MKFGFGYDYIHGIRPLFQLGNEQNIPTWYAICTLLISSSLLLIIARLERTAPNGLYWHSLSAIFLLLAYDEAFSVHEKLGRFGKGFVVNEGIFHFAWIAPASLIVLVVGLFFLRFLISLERSTRNGFILAGSVYIGGAIGFEAIGGSYLSANGDNLGYALVETAEEALEMLGIYVFILTLLKYLETNFGTITISFDSSSAPR